MKKENKKVIPSNWKRVYKKFSHLIPYKHIEVPREHRSDLKNIHSLRCFKMIWQRDEKDNKLFNEPKVRCKLPVVEGYLYCRKHGRYKMPLIKPDEKMNELSTASIYRDVYDAEMGDLLTAFLNDPQMLDLKPELANLRLILNNYIKKLLEKPRAGSRNDFMSQVREIIMEEDKDDNWRFEKITELTESLSTITNGKAIDRINRCVENIGKTIERIRKIEEKDDFLLTPAGMKIFLRAMVDLMNESITDKELKKRITEGLLTLSIETKGDVSLYQTIRNSKVVDAEVVEQ